MATNKTLASNRFQETFGYPAGRAAVKVKDAMTPFVQEFIQNAPFAVMATTLVVIAVFVPIAFLEGLTGRLFRELAITVSAAVATEPSYTSWLAGFST